VARLELIGDSARGEDYAAVRLVLDDRVIVEADAPGLERSLLGLSLLEAAAVPGEILAADALANAIAPAFTATPAAGRIAVAMSGGVDSAVALVRAAPNAIGARNSTRPPAHIRRGWSIGGKKPPRAGWPSGPRVDCGASGKPNSQCANGGSAC